MSKANNLTDFLVNTANAIRTAEGSTALINPQDFESHILALGGGSGTHNIYVLNTFTITLDSTQCQDFDDADEMYFYIMGEEGTESCRVGYLISDRHGTYKTASINANVFDITADGSQLIMGDSKTETMVIGISGLSQQGTTLHYIGIEIPGINVETEIWNGTFDIDSTPIYVSLRLTKHYTTGNTITGATIEGTVFSMYE